jgi:hypothetical protein
MPRSEGIYRQVNRDARRTFAGVAAAAILATPAYAEQDATELAKQLSNPVAALISVPLQFNFDENIGPAEEGDRTTLNIQPVIPASLNDKWNLITRVILPVIAQDDIYPGAGSQSGTGDTVASAFFSPKAPTSGGWIWAVGPVLLLPTGSDTLLTSDKWGAGPTGLMLKQHHGWTYGALVNHIWSFAGESERDEVSSTFLQPFLSFTTPKAVTYGVNFEGSYDWTGEQWSLPLHATMTKVTKVGGQLLSFGGGVRYWVDSPDSGAHDLGVRLIFTLLFPK